MEISHPTLRRPKRKLYFNERSSNHWTKQLSLMDVDRMFDDIDVCADLYPTCATLQSSDSGTNQSGTSGPSVAQEKQPTENPPGLQIISSSPFKPELDDDLFQPAIRSHPKLDIDLDIPFKAHGPVKTSSPIEQNMMEKPGDESSSAVFPILFNCKTEAVEEPDQKKTNTQKTQRNERVTDNSDDGEMESPPSRVTLIKKSFHKEAVKASCQERTEPCVPAVSHEPEGSAVKNVSESVPKQPPVETSSHVGKDMTAFLQKVKQSIQSKPTKNPAVKAHRLPPPPPPEPEDDFFILEDDAPLWVSIPSKSATKRRQKLSKTSSSDKESLAERELKDSSVDVPQDEQELEMANSKPESQAVIRKTNTRKKSNEKKTESENYKECLPGPEEFPDQMEQQEPKKKKQLKVFSPTSRTNTLKKSRKRLQGSTAATSVADDENQDQVDEETAGTEHRDIEADGETKQNKESAESRESSSEDVLVLQKRRRKPSGHGWSRSQSSGEAENPLPPKKSKQNQNNTAPSTERVKKDKANKKSNQKQPVLISTNHTDQTKESKSKQTKKRETKGEKVKETDKILNAAEEENPDQEESSPLVLTHRDLSFNSGGQLFHRVYNHSSSENISLTSTAAEEDQPWEAEPAKRRRKPPSNWWEVNNAAHVSASASSQPQQLHRKEPKPKKEEKKQPKGWKSGLGTPKNGNIAAGSKPLGVTPVLLPKPRSAPKTVKRSLAVCKDIFTSVVETPTVDADEGERQRSGGGVASRPAQKDPEFVTGSRAGGDELCSGIRHDHQTPQDGACLSEDTLKVLKSGPSSLIELENYEDNNEADLQTSRVQIMLSVSDLCAPPLKPLTLHSKDKSDLIKWFQSLWSSSADDDAVITPDQFQWYFYKDRALGIQADLNSSSICYGKILMGSYMKKPLWVDHSATTFFNLLTSSVSVTVDGRVSRYSPGQAFMVECGRAYSIHNTNAQPAVLYFTRISAESPD